MKLYEISNEPGRKLFLDKLIAFNEERGNTISSCPSINKGLIDLFLLYNCVKERGGFIQTTKSKLWKECATICNIKQQPTSAYILRKQYIKHLLPFECKFDLNGADLAQVVASTENANRKKRKKTGNESTPALQTPNGQLVTNSILNGKPDNLPSINQIPNQQQASTINLQSPSLNQAQNRHLTMQQQSNYSSSTNSTNNLMNSSHVTNAMTQQNSNSITNMSAAALQSGYNYSNSNYSNSNLTNYVPTNGTANLYQTTNSLYNQAAVDYQSKLNHQLSVPSSQQQQPQFNCNAQMLNSTSAANQQQTLVNLTSNNQLNSQQASQQQQQFYNQQQQSMYGNVIQNGPTNDFYATSYSTNQLPSSALYNSPASSLQFQDDLIKYSSSRPELAASNSQTSLTSNQLNTSNNQYYNNHSETPTSYSSTIYNNNRANSYQLNGYTNAMLESSFDKSSTNLDNYLNADPYAYEPENKRFHAMSNC